MKKMLAKAVVLGLVLGGIGFVANDAQAAEISEKGIGVHTNMLIPGDTILHADDKINTSLATHEDLKKVNTEAEDATRAAGEAKNDAAKAQKTADDNTEAINKEVTERKAEVARLDSKIDKLDTRVEKVGAMAAAIANLHTMGYDPEAPTEIAVGVGQYRDKTGMALGAFHYPNRDFMLSFSVSTAGDEYMGGIGATWKFGRKTPEELRQAEAEKAAKAKLAKAEAAKKAAKDARVAAQQKRHAEMLAARTAK